MYPTLTSLSKLYWASSVPTTDLHSAVWVWLCEWELHWKTQSARLCQTTLQPLCEHSVRVAYETHGCELANSNSLRSVFLLHKPHCSGTGVYMCMAVGEGFADNVEDDCAVLEKWNDTLFLSAACGWHPSVCTWCPYIINVNYKCLRASKGYWCGNCVYPLKSE